MLDPGTAYTNKQKATIFQCAEVKSPSGYPGSILTANTPISILCTYHRSVTALLCTGKDIPEGF